MTTVLIAGAATLDFVFDVDEMPRRAEKYRAREAAMVGGGGAANAAVAVARLGGDARLCARLGDDSFGTMMIGLLELDGVDCAGVKRFSGRRSSFSSVFVDAKAERQIVNFRDDSFEDDAGWLADCLPADFGAALSDTRWPAGALALMRAASATGKPGVMDAEAPVRIALDALKAASHIAFSEQGLRDFSGTDDLTAGLRAAAIETGAWVCVTEGGKGVSYLRDRGMVHAPAFAVEAAETLGAGDVWHGAFALALGEGKAEPEAVCFANATAAIKCSRRGGRAGYPTRGEVEDMMKDAA